MRLCSNVVIVLLAFGIASPAFAAGKKKKDDSAEESKDDAEATAEEEDEPKSKKGKKGKQEEAEEEDSLDSKMEQARGDTKGDATEGAPESAEASQEMPDPNVWERPPEDEEKPKKEVAALKEEKGGDNRPWMAGLIAGYGLLLDSTSREFGADPYGIGFGLRGGYSFDFNLYAGLAFHYFIGSTKEGQVGMTTLTPETTASYMQIAAEVGYDAWIGDSVILRPSLQLGVALGFFTTGDASRDANSPQGGMLVAPGLAVLFPIDGWFIGGELRPSIVAGNGTNGLLLAAHGGLRFE